MSVRKSAPERVDDLIALSDRVYEVIDQDNRAQRMLSVGIQAVAQTLENSHGFRVGGDTAHRLLIAGLHEGGLSIDDPAYNNFPTYRRAVSNFSPVLISRPDEQLRTFAAEYGRVPRRTIDFQGVRESNARHVAHLGALALPYAAEYYSELDPSLVALYTLVHDAVERYVGDTPTLNISHLAQKEKELREQRGLEMLRSEFVSTYPKFVKVVEQYEERTDDEAKFVKTIDKNDPHFVHLYTSAQILIEEFGLEGEEEFWRAMDEERARILQYGIEYGTVLDDRAVFIELSAARTWPQAT